MPPVLQMPSQQAAPQAPALPSAPEQIAISPDNPDQQQPQTALQRYGLKPEDGAELLQVIKNYRSDWMTDRQLRMANWRKNVLFDRGKQVLEWDDQAKLYYDALAWYRQQGGDQALEAAELEKFINNITQMLKTAFVASLSRGIPPTVIRPENAEILADVTTARAGQDAITIIERMNRIRSMVRVESGYLFLFGCYFKHTRYVIDGEWAGYNEDPMYGDVPVTRPDRLRCLRCGTETPMQQLAGPASQSTTQVTPQGKYACPSCNQGMDASNFWPAEQSTETGFVGMSRDAKGMVKWTVHSPMEVDCDPTAKELDDTPLLALEQEIDIGQLRTMFPQYADKIQQGTDSSTTALASYEKQARAETYSVDRGGTQTANKPTYTQVWVQPWAFARSDKSDWARKMQQLFPRGLYAPIIGEEIMDLRGVSLSKEWTCARLNDEHGMFPPAIADVVVPFNERVNDAMSTIDQHNQRCAAGITLVNAGYLDIKKMAGRRLVPGELFMVYTKGEGQKKNLDEILYQFKFEIDPHIREYPQMLIEMAQVISGVQPQLQGAGTQPGVETLGGQQMQLDQASGRLAIYWENLKEEHALASQNAIECLAKNMSEDIWSVVEAEGSAFRNDYVHLDELQGRVRVYPDIDSGLPSSPEQIRQSLQQILDAATKGAEWATAIVDIPANQETMFASFGTPQLVQPGKAQTATTEQHIRILLDSPAVPDTPQMSADGQAVPQYKLPVTPEPYATDYTVARATIMQFKQENDDLSRSNPTGWALLSQYQQLLITQDTKEAAEESERKSSVVQAGQPKPPQSPPPDPAMQSAKQELVKVATGAVDRLSQVGAMPPLGQGQSLQSQVAADSKLLDSGLKVALQP